MIEPVAHVDEADIAEGGRPVDGADECHMIPSQLGENPNADAGDLLDQRLSTSGHDNHPSAADRAGAALVSGRVFWSAWKSNSLVIQRSFIDDVASRNNPYGSDQ